MPNIAIRYVVGEHINIYLSSDTLARLVVAVPEDGQPNTPQSVNQGVAKQQYITGAAVSFIYLSHLCHRQFTRPQHLLFTESIWGQLLTVKYEWN
jgi:hypothetical protein